MAEHESFPGTPDVSDLLGRAVSLVATLDHRLETGQDGWPISGPNGAMAFVQAVIEMLIAIRKTNEDDSSEEGLAPRIDRLVRATAPVAEIASDAFSRLGIVVCFGAVPVLLPPDQRVVLLSTLLEDIDGDLDSNTFCARLEGLPEGTWLVARRAQLDRLSELATWLERYASVVVQGSEW